MPVEVFHIGVFRHPVVVIDNAIEAPERINNAAEALAPFPIADNSYYPGLRRYIRPGIDGAYSYVDAVCRGISPLMRDVFGVEKFAVTEASFSLLTQRPADLEPIQYLPHFDSHDPRHFAVLHYLSRKPSGGTAFYRHRRTGITLMSSDRLDAYMSAIDIDAAEYGPPRTAFIDESNESWERTCLIEGNYNRIVIYQGALFHSALIPSDFHYNTDPKAGRLTANIFLRAGAQ